MEYNLDYFTSEFLLESGQYFYTYNNFSLQL